MSTIALPEGIARHIGMETLPIRHPFLPLNVESLFSLDISNHDPCVEIGDGSSITQDRLVDFLTEKTTHIHKH